MNRNIRFQRCVKYFEQVNKELQFHLKNWDVASVRKGFRILGSFLAKETSPIFALRACRSYQILHLHSRLWSSHFACVTKSTTLMTNSRKWFLGFVFVSLCDKKIEKNNEASSVGRRDAGPADKSGIIKKSELTEHLHDLDYIHELTAATVICPHCKDRLLVDKKLPNVKYCHCPSTTTAIKKISGYPWVPFVETPDLLIWRKPHDSRPGLFIYKVYGYYDDISPADFLETQLDLKYRKKWDNSVLKLDLVESDERNQVDIVHWEMQWPRMFSNRDYCFARRHLVDKTKNTMIILNKAVENKKVPEVNGVVRVKEYWSVMHINGVKGLENPGVEFGLTYYDNPGLSLPTWLSNWAAMTAIPDFLNKVRNAARARRKLEGSKIYLYSPQSPSRDGATGENSTLITVNQPASSPRNSEILSQFFKENILEASLNEVEA